MQQNWLRRSHRNLHCIVPAKLMKKALEPNLESVYAVSMLKYPEIVLHSNEPK